MFKISTHSGTFPIITSAFSVRIYEPFHACSFTACYGAVMISSLNSIKWPIYLSFFEKRPPNLFITRNLSARIPWISLLTYPLRLVFLLQVFSFLYLLWLEWALKRAGILPPWPHNSKRNGAMIVVLMVSAIMVSL